MRRGLVVAGLAGGFLLIGAQAASAHPLGNFTVNTADRITVTDDSVRVEHVVDFAEIPTLQLGQGAGGTDVDGDGRTTDAELATWAGAECARTGGELSLVVDGSRTALTVTSAAARSLPGQAGLPTMRLDCSFASAGQARSTVAFDDPSSAGRTGWKEVSATALCGKLTGDVVADSPSALLVNYPQDLLSSPPAVTSASFGVSAGGACRAEAANVPAPSQVLPRGVDRLTTSYTAFVSRQHLTLPVALLAVLLSIALGCGHAVAPGHGKTVIAAYLVGQRGTKRQAVWLGATVTATHTAGVLLLGALLSLTSVAAPERFVPATEVASGLLLGGVGVFLLRRSLRARSGRLAADHDHGHDGHDHDPGHARSHQDHKHPHPHDGAHSASHDGDHSHGHDGAEHDHGDHSHSHGDAEHDHGEHSHDHGDAEHDHGEHSHSDSDAEHDHDGGHAHPHQPVAPLRVLVPAGGSPDGEGQLLTAPAPGRTRTLEPVVHSHGGRAHSHLPVADAPLGWRTLATMGIAGGLVPSPSALVVLLGAAALGRPVFGAVLVVGYGVGMAITLTVAGLLLLRAQAMLERRGWAAGRSAGVLRVLPFVTAAVVLAVGALVIVRGLLTFRGLG